MLLDGLLKNGCDGVVYSLICVTIKYSTSRTDLVFQRPFHRGSKLGVHVSGLPLKMAYSPLPIPEQ